MTCVSSRAIVSNSFITAVLRRVKCAKHCTLDFCDLGDLHGVHQCVLSTRRVALRLGCCILLAKEYNQRDILQHLLRTLLLLLTGAASRCSRGVHNTGGDLLDCCTADCLGVCTAATMTFLPMVPLLYWLAGWLVGLWVVVLNSCSATMYGLRVYWALGLHRPPTASDRSQHGCTVGVNRDPPVWPSTHAGWWRNQSASLTYTGRRATIIEEMWIMDVYSCISGDSPKRVVDFPRERDTIRNKIMEIDEKKLQQQR